MTTPPIHADQPIRINRRYINEARKRAQHEAWMWRYCTGTPRPNWHKQAACLGMHPDLFFADDTNKAKPPTHIIEICDQCPVRQDCGQACIQEETNTDINTIHGIRAGLSAQTRWKLYRKMNQLGLR
jgi:hypothetical protein